MLCKTVFTISGESREVTCSFSKMLEKSSWTSSILMQLLFKPFFLGFCSVITWLGITRYYVTTDLMRARGIIDTFHIFRWSRLLESSKKKRVMMLMEWNKFLTQHFPGGLFQASSLKFILVFVFYETFK